MKAIVCMNENGGIGYKNSLPWKSKKDLRFFKEITTGNGNNAVVMGRKTFDSMKQRPLFGRRNYVMTKNNFFIDNFKEDLIVESNPVNIILLDSIFDNVFIIGGSEIYKLFEDCIDTIYVTHIKNNTYCDAYFPINLINFKRDIISETVDENNQTLIFCLYTRTIDIH